MNSFSQWARGETVLACVLRHAESVPDETAWLQVAPDGSTRRTSRAELVRRAAGVARALENEGVERGSIVPLIVPHTESLAAAWLGTLMRGAIPTILAEPSVRMPPEDYRKMLARLFLYLAPAAAIIQGKRCSASVSDIGVRRIDLDGVSPEDPAPSERGAAGDTVALQHSSGTTGMHKGVMMSNAQILDQVVSYGQALALDPATDKVASWLPLYHDMGFIACFVMPLVYGIETVQMSAFDWVIRPWMLPVAVSQTRATLSWLPNFAFHLLAHRCASEHLEGVDLSSWRQIINCSEPCTSSAFDRLHERFGPYGLSRTALGVSYASAETIFAVTEGGVRRPLVRREVDSQAFHSEFRLLDAPGGITVIGCGTPIAGASVQIRNGRFEKQQHDTIGEIWVKAPFLMQGYFRRPDLDEEVFREGWYRTGDLGCVGPDGEVYVTGRIKDLIIVGGINIPPQDVEEIASEVSGVIPGRVVAVGAWDSNLETQRLVLLVESSDGDAESRHRINRAIRAAVAARTQVQVSDVRVLPRGVLRKSTSGKLSRRANLQLYEDGPPEEALWIDHERVEEPLEKREPSA